MKKTSVEDYKLFSNELVSLARGVQTKRQTKDEVAQKGIACTQATQREHRDFEENSIPKRALIAQSTYL
jgi:hypothetical protein